MLSSHSYLPGQEQSARQRAPEALGVFLPQLRLRTLNLGVPGSNPPRALTCKVPMNQPTCPAWTQPLPALVGSQPTLPSSGP